MTKLGEGAGAQLGPEPDVARPDPRQVLAALADDGPDEMGRDLAGAADVVEATLIEVGTCGPGSRRCSVAGQAPSWSEPGCRWLWLKPPLPRGSSLAVGRAASLRS